LETHGHRLDNISTNVFGNKKEENDLDTETADLKEILKRLGATGNVLSKVRESLVSLARLLSFFGPASEHWLRLDNQAHVKSLIRDVRFLNEYCDSIEIKINFLLDATLGFIDIQQTNTMKILSIASVVFLPPTLIASVFGMNFSYIPILHTEWGFFLAVILMLLVAIFPYYYLKKKGL
jgi:magnesium transporter